MKKSTGFYVKSKSKIEFKNFNLLKKYFLLNFTLISTLQIVNVSLKILGN